MESIKHAAVVALDGRVFMGRTHGCCFQKAKNIGVEMSSKADHQGFVTSTGRFVTREEGGRIALTAGQIDKETPYLFSEDFISIVYNGKHKYCDIQGYILLDEKSDEEKSSDYLRNLLAEKDRDSIPVSSFERDWNVDLESFTPEERKRNFDLMHSWVKRHQQSITDASAAKNKALSLLKECNEELTLAHAYIVNLQHAYNDCRDWFSNIEFIPETEDMDEDIDMSDCDEREAVRLKGETEEVAMDGFGYWFDLVDKKYDLKDLNGYNRFIDNQLPKLGKLFLAFKEKVKNDIN